MSSFEGLLTDMRSTVCFTHQASMPIPLYERIKEALQSREAVPMDDEMVEAVAKALLESSNELCHKTAAGMGVEVWELLQEVGRQEYLADAKAAIIAINERMKR